MNKIIKYSVFFGCFFLPIFLFGQRNNKETFKKSYSFEKVYKAEVSLFEEEGSNQIDFNQLLKVLQNTKRAFVKFVPYKVVKFYDQDGKTFELFFSGDNMCFSSANKAFMLTKKQSIKVAEILK